MISITVLAIIIIVASLNTTLGTAVFLRNTSAPLNRNFLGLSLSATLWTITSLVSDDTQSFELSKYASSAAFSFGFLGLVYIALFTYTLRDKVLSRSKTVLVYSLSILLALLFATPLVYELVNLVDFEIGILYVPYLILLVGLLVYSSFNMVRAYKMGDKKQRNQVRLILLGIVVMVIGGVIFNLILPLLFSSSEFVFTSIGPLFSVVFVYSTAYAVVKHRLFDFKAVFARAVTYLFVVGIVIVAYVSAGFLLKRIIAPDLQVTAVQLGSNVVLAVLLVTTFPKIKKILDKTSSRFFYQDSYDAQTFIDTLNQALVADVEVKSLLEKATRIIEMNIKASYCGFYIRETAYLPSRFVANHKNNIPLDILENIRQLTPNIRNKIHSVDYQTENSEEKILNELLKDNDIEVIGRLVSTMKYKVAGVGYMLLGPKNSGEVYSRQDLKVLDIISNELVLAIENALRLEEIEQFNVTLQKKIDDATRELKRSNEKLKALDEAKDEFVSMASHQLRTPLTSIKGYLSMVIDGDAGEISPTQKEMLGQAFFSSQRMVYLISDLLNVSRIKTGKFLIEPTPIYLPEIVQEEIDQLRDGAKSKDLTIEFVKPETFSRMMLDLMKTRQVIMNFMDNAIYYTPVGGKIQVALKETKKSIEFTVTDNGIGVPKEQQYKLFTKFYRAENARKTRPDGTGLGLFMAKKVIIAQGGSLVFKSEENKGSTFGFSFPKEKLLAQDNPKT
jgi:signal transduction histidine kinase